MTAATASPAEAIRVVDHDALADLAGSALLSEATEVEAVLREA